MAWSDNITRLISTQTGKTVHSLANHVGPDPQIASIHWGTTLTDSRATRSRINRSGSDLTLDDILSQAAQNYNPNTFTDLPKNLALLDIDRSLPKLSVLTAGSKEYQPLLRKTCID